MKLIYAGFFLFLFSVTGFAQDTLFTKDGKIINAKVLEVRSTQVKYKNQTEKQFSWIDTKELNSIHYKNGTQDVFETLADSTSFRSTIVEGRKVPNQPSEITFDNKAKADAYAQKAARQEAVADAVFLGIRVVGFILQAVLEVAVGSSCHSSHDHHHSSSGNHGTNRPR